MPTAFDFSDILIRNDEWPRNPRPLEGLNETDSAIVRWLRKVVTRREAGTLRWASDPSNLDGFQAWPAYTSVDNLEVRPRPQDRQRKAAPRRRR